MKLYFFISYFKFLSYIISNIIYIFYFFLIFYTYIPLFYFYFK